MDVPVNMQLKFPQFYELDILVRQRQVRTVSNCAGDREDFTGAVLG